MLRYFLIPIRDCPALVQYNYFACDKDFAFSQTNLWIDQTETSTLSPWKIKPRAFNLLSNDSYVYSGEGGGVGEAWREGFDTTWEELTLGIWTNCFKVTSKAFMAEIDMLDEFKGCLVRTEPCPRLCLKGFQELCDVFRLLMNTCKRSCRYFAMYVHGWCY